MSVQGSSPSTIPSRVRVDPFDTGRPIVATVVDSTLKATATVGPHDLLTVEYQGSTYRVDASEAQAYPPAPSTS